METSTFYNLRSDALQALEGQDFAQALELYEAAARSSDSDADGDAEFLCDHTRALYGAGRIQEAILKAEAALRAAGDDRKGRTRALRLRAESRIVQRQFGGAEADLREVLAICLDTDDQPGRIRALRDLASALAGMGQVHEAASRLSTAAAVCREVGGPASEPRARAIEGYRAFVLSDYPQARLNFEAALAAAAPEELQEPAAYLLARTCLFLGDLDAARERFQSLVLEYQHEGAHLSEACMWMYLGEIALESGDAGEAMARGDDAERVLVRGALGEQEDLYLRRVRALRAQAAAEQGDVALAQSLVDAARPQAGTDFGLIGRWPRSVIWRRLGRVFQLAGDGDRAGEAFGRAVEIGADLKEWEWARSTLALAEFQAASGDTERARGSLQAAHDAFRRMGSERYESRAIRALTELEAAGKPDPGSALVGRDRPPGIVEGPDDRLGDLVGASEAMRRIYRLIERAAASDVTVLLTGETGTGKDLAAQAIHSRGIRRQKLFVAQSCATLHGDLLLSELFGHRKGAFTGAVADRIGLFEAADGGTVFLDEIGEATPEVQVALLRVLDTGEVRRLGEAKESRVDVRVVAATNRDLQAAVRAGTFREDLYYRLEVFEIPMPPLRARTDDIRLLSEHLLQRAARELGKQVGRLTPAALQVLGNRDWPGNVRELYNVLQRAVALAQAEGDVDVDHVTEPGNAEAEGSSPGVDGFSSDEDGALRSRVDAFERRLIIESLTQRQGSVTEAAKHLKITRRGLYKKLNRYGIDPDSYR